MASARDYRGQSVHLIPSDLTDPKAGPLLRTFAIEADKALRYFRDIVTGQSTTIISVTAVDVVDASFRILDDLNPLKIAQFQCASLAVGTTIFTLPLSQITTPTLLASDSGNTLKQTLYLNDDAYISKSCTSSGTTLTTTSSGFAIVEVGWLVVGPGVSNPTFVVSKTDDNNVVLSVAPSPAISPAQTVYLCHGLVYKSGAIIMPKSLANKLAVYQFNNASNSLISVAATLESANTFVVGMSITTTGGEDGLTITVPGGAPRALRIFTDATLMGSFSNSGIFTTKNADVWGNGIGDLLSHNVSAISVDRVVTWPDATGLPLFSAVVTGLPAAGSLVYGAGATTGMTALAIGALNTVLTSSGTAPQWSTNAAVVDVARTWATLQTFPDDKIKIVGSVTASKALLFELDGATAAKTLTLASNHTLDRTVTLPDATTTLAGLAVAQTFTLLNTYTPAANATAISVQENVASVSGYPFEILASAGERVFAYEPTTGAVAFGGAGLKWYVNGSIDGVSTSVLLQAGTVTSDFQINFQDTMGGDFVTSASTHAQTIAGNKTFLSGTILKSNTASVGVSFSDNGTASRRLRMILSGAVGNNTLTFANTAARDYKHTDYTSSLVLVGNTTAAAGTLGTSALTAQTGNVGATTLLTSSANSSGLFRVSFYVKTTTAGTPAVALVKITVAYNDGAAQAADVLLTAASATPAASAINHDLGTLNAASYGAVIVKGAASNAITFTTTGTYTGSPQYSLDARIEALG